MKSQVRRGASPQKTKLNVSVRKKLTIKQWIGMGLILCFVLVIMDVNYSHFLTDKLAWPIERVTINSNYYFVNQRKIQERIQSSTNQGFLFVDLRKIKEDIESIPLVDNVAVKRVWPDSLVIDVEEEMPVATWNNKGVMDNDGDIFVVENLPSFESLPKLSGLDDTKRLVLNKYYTMSAVLQKIGLSVSRMDLKPRGAWEIELTGIELNEENIVIQLLLGREFLEEKLTRFIAIYQGFLINHAEKIAIVDARYTNGLAVTWRSKIDADKQGT